MLNLKKSTWVLIALMIIVPTIGFAIKPDHTIPGLLLILLGGPGILLYLFLATVFGYASNSKLL